MLVLIIVGLAVGENLNWLAGLLLICAGLYVGGIAGGVKWRHRQESFWAFLGLASLVVIFLFGCTSPLN
ncbi:hypothetical protein [Shewanella sp. BJSY2023SW005]|uniref:hypothetical protein n=1 Tax=Shewanella sp. BJSY2023SW005 TaxID=3392043 RepID=UPI0039B4EC87